MSWPWATLSELCLPVAKMDPILTGRREVRYVDIGGIDGPKHALTEVPWIASEAAPSRCRQVLQGGDTVFSTVRPYLEKIAYIDESLNGEFASTGFCVLRPSEAVEPRFLFYFASSRGLLDQVLPKQKGVSYPAVLDREVRACSVPIPPRAEQRRIVAILEEHLSDLDAAVVSVGRAGEKSVAMIASARRRAVERAVALDGTSTVGQHALLVEYGSSQKAHEIQSEGDIPVLRMGNIQDGHLKFAPLKYLSAAAPGVRNLVLERGDLLFNRTNSAELVGKSAVFDADIEATFASYLIRVRFDPEVRPEWANIVVNSPQGRAYIAAIASQQVGQANVNGTKLKGFPLPVPALTLQDELVASFREVEAAAERLRAQTSRGLGRAASLRHGILSAAFSSRLTGQSADAEVISELTEESA